MSEFKKDESGNIVMGLHVGLNTKQCIIINDDPEKLISTVGIEKKLIIQRGNQLFVIDMEKVVKGEL